MGDKGTVNIGDVRPFERTEPRLKPSRAVGDGKPKGTCIRKEASAMLTQSKCCRTLTQSKCCRTLTYVLIADGSQLMPTFNIKKGEEVFQVRHKGKKWLSFSEAEPVIDKKTGQSTLEAGSRCR